MRYIKLSAIAIVVFSALFSCADRGQHVQDESSLSRAVNIFTAENNRARKHLPNGQYPKSIEMSDRENVIYEGFKLHELNFDPKWDQACVDSLRVDVPIKPTHIFMAEIYVNSDDLTAVAELPILQRLVFELSNSSCYLASMIPTLDYYKTLNLDKLSQFQNITDFSDFSGAILYSTLDGDYAKIEKYNNGHLERSVSRNGTLAGEVPRRHPLMSGDSTCQDAVSPGDREFANVIYDMLGGRMMVSASVSQQDIEEHYRARDREMKKMQQKDQ